MSQELIARMAAEQAAEPGYELRVDLSLNDVLVVVDGLVCSAIRSRHGERPATELLERLRLSLAGKGFAAHAETVKAAIQQVQSVTGRGPEAPGPGN